MTPAARIAAAIDLLDRVFAGELADRALAGWGRQNRYAGSKDRAAIGDLVYAGLRKRNSLAALGGGVDGRAVMIGALRAAGDDPDTMFGAGPYAPDALSAAEQSAGRMPDDLEATDIPAWLWPEFATSLDPVGRDVARVMRDRAPVHLRVNLSHCTRTAAIAQLAAHDITAHAHPLSPAALEVTEGARKIRNAPAYLEGAVELQDASSQAITDMVPLQTGQSMLDYCAGGGGKTLGVAGRVAADFYAHDIDPRRMKDIAARAARAGVTVKTLTTDQVGPHGPYDCVLVDAPCSGSGSWRRDPQGKWLLTEQTLADTVALQSAILDQAGTFVSSGGFLVYATCSVLTRENSAQIQGFMSRNTAFSLVEQKQFTPLDGGDGFFGAVLQQN